MMGKNAVHKNIVNQLSEPQPEKMIWMAQGLMPAVHPAGTARKTWQTMFQADFARPVLDAVADMRRFNKGLKIKVVAIVLLEDDKLEKFNEGY